MRGGEPLLQNPTLINIEKTEVRHLAEGEEGNNKYREECGSKCKRGGKSADSKFVLLQFAFGSQTKAFLLWSEILTEFQCEYPSALAPDEVCFVLFL